MLYVVWKETERLSSIMVLAATSFNSLTYLCFSNRANKKIRTWLLFTPVSQSSTGKWVQNATAESGDSWGTLPAEGDGTPEVSLSLLFHSIAYCIIGTIQMLFAQKGQITWSCILDERGWLLFPYGWSCYPFFTFSTIPEILKRLSLCTHNISFY